MTFFQKDGIPLATCNARQKTNGELVTFFTEFEFHSPTGNLYWFPLYIEADSPLEASDYVERIATGIRQNYSLASLPRPVPVFTAFQSERLAEYRQKRATGKPQVLNVTQWRMRTIEGAPDVSFDRQTDEEIAALPERFFHDGPRSLTLATGYQYSFPVHVVSSGRIQDEFLLVNVVMPQTAS